jgi:hypothetical protein
VLNDAFYIIGLKEAMRKCKTRRKQLLTRESQKDQSLATENNLEKKYRIMKIRKHCRVRTPHIYYSVLHLSHILTAEDKTKNITLQMLMNEIQTLKMKCDILQNVVDNLKSRCNTYKTLIDRN